MKKVHLNPETGDTGVCKASNKCPFGGEENHYETTSEAREAFEAANSSFPPSKTIELEQPAQVALNAVLGDAAAPPKWLLSKASKARELGYPEPELIAMLPLDTDQVAAVWEPRSLAPEDAYQIDKRGIRYSQLLLSDPKTGETIGSLRFKQVTEASQKQAFGDDNLSPLRWAEYSLGVNFDTDHYDPETDSWALVSLENSADLSKQELLTLKKSIWAEGHKNLGVTPKGFDLNRTFLKRLSNLDITHAPEEEAELDEAIERIATSFRKPMALQTEALANPIVDMVEIEPKHRGKGLAKSLYILAGRKVAEEGKQLIASEIQTPETQKLWQRMRKNGLPVKPITRVTPDNHNQPTVISKLALDFKGV